MNKYRNIKKHIHIYGIFIYFLFLKSLQRKKFIQSYTGKDIHNYDTMKTTGGSVGFTTGNVPLSNIGFNQETRDKEGITRNTVTENVNVHNATGDAINRDISRANETTRDTHSRTNINVESQTIQYVANPDKLKEDLSKAKQEIKDVAGAFNESINDRGDDNRNFFGQLRETRLNETIYNIAGERLDKSKTQEDIRKTLEATYKDLGYDVRIRFSTAEETAALKGKSGTAYVGDDGVLTAIINSDYLNGKTKGEIIGVISEEASHVINGYEGRQIATGTSEKGLESTGRATNEYFKEKYKDDNTRITLTSEGAIDTSKLGTNVGDKIIISDFEKISEYHEGMASIYIASIVQYFKKDGEFYDEKFLNDIREELTTLISKGKVLKNISSSEDIKMIFNILSDANLSVKDKNSIDYDGKGKYLILPEEKELNPAKDIAVETAREAIKNEEHTAVYRIIEKRNEEENMFIEDFKKKIDMNTSIPEEKKEEIKEKIDETWDIAYRGGHFSVSDNFSVVVVARKENGLNYLTYSTDTGGMNNLGLERVNNSSLTAETGHEIRHFVDTINPNFVKKNKDTKIFEKNGLVYSSDNYNIINGKILFYPIRSQEFNTVTEESIIREREGIPPRAVYNISDVVEITDSGLKNKTISTEYNEKMDIGAVFEKLTRELK